MTTSLINVSMTSDDPMMSSSTAPSLKTQLPMMTLNSVAVLAALLTVGTGGVANPEVTNFHAFTGPVSPTCSLHVNQSDEERILETQEKIAGIRHYLSVTVTELAATLRVGRPTVYSWATTAVSLRSAHRQRIEALYAIARQWRALSNKPMGSLVREPLEDGKTMIDLLSAKEFDSTAIRARMRLIQEQQGRIYSRLTVAEAAENGGVQLASRPRRNWRSSGEIILPPKIG